MFMRLLQLTIKAEAGKKLQDFYESRAIPALKKVPGCLFANLIQQRNKQEQVISMTMWHNKESAEAYDNSPVYHGLIKELEPFFAGSSEWKIQLSENLELKYEPVKEEPLIRSYTIKAQKEIITEAKPKPQQLCTRIVSLRVQPGKLDELNKIYSGEVIPELQATKGCIYAYLMESMQAKDEVLSVTIWENRETAEGYELSGKYSELLGKIKHTFSKFSQWKMSLEKDEGKQVKTSEDLAVSHYKVITGETFAGKREE